MFHHQIYIQREKFLLFFVYSIILHIFAIKLIDYYARPFTCEEIKKCHPFVEYIALYLSNILTENIPVKEITLFAPNFPYKSYFFK
jgi:hypothetical protein